MTEISQWIEHPEQMGSDAIGRLPELIAQYPYCATLRMLYTIALGNVHSTRMNEELRRTAVWMPDRMKLFQMVNNGEYEWVALMLHLERMRQQQKPEENDFILIDRFLNQTPLTDVERPTDTSGYDPLSMLADEINDDVSDPSVSDILPASDDDDDTFALIDHFIEAEQKGALFVPQTEPKVEIADDSESIAKIRDRAFLTESLAKVYAKQGKYEQALAIFSELNLKYPKKNCYFADQIRFLETVIAYREQMKTAGSKEEKEP